MHHDRMRGVIPESLRKEFRAFRDQSIWLRTCHDTFAALFDSDQETEAALKRVAPLFFTELNHALQEYWLMQACRLTDEANAANLTVNTLNASLRQALGELPDPVRDASRGMMSYRNRFLTLVRNKLLAHAGKDAILKGEALGAHLAEELAFFLESLHAYNDAFGEAIGEGPLDFRGTSGAGDVLDLISFLKRARLPE